MVKPRKNTAFRKTPVNFLNSNPPPLFQMKKVKKDLYGFFNNNIGKDISNIKNYGKREVKNVVAFGTTEAKKLKKMTKDELRYGYSFLKKQKGGKDKPQFLPIESKEVNFLPPNIYPKRTPAEIRIIDKDPWGDKDKDNVPNWFDCKPNKKSEQGFMTKVTKKSLKRYRPQVERIAKKMERRLIPIQAELTRIGNKITEEKERVAEKRAEREAKRLLQQGVPMSEIAKGIPIDLNAIPTDPSLQKELEKTASKFQAEYLGYHSALNVLREEPNPLRKMLIKKEGNEKRVIGFIYEDSHVLARRKGFMPEVKAEAQKIEEQYLIKQMQDRIPDEWGMPKKDIQISKHLKLAPYDSPIETGVISTSNVTGKIGELAASRVLKKKLSPEELKSHIEIDTIYILPEERGKGYGKKVIESLMKRPGLKKITASGEREVYGKAWAPTGAIQKEFDPSAAVELSKDRGLTESEQEEEEFAAKLKEGHVDFEWIKKEPSKFQQFVSDKGATFGRKKEKKELTEKEKKSKKAIKNFTKSFLNQMDDALFKKSKEKNIIKQMSPEMQKNLETLSPVEREDAIKRYGMIIEGPTKDEKGNWSFGGEIPITIKEEKRKTPELKKYIKDTYRLEFGITNKKAKEIKEELKDLGFKLPPPKKFKDIVQEAMEEQENEIIDNDLRLQENLRQDRNVERIIEESKKLKEKLDDYAVGVRNQKKEIVNKLSSMYIGESVLNKRKEKGLPKNIPPTSVPAPVNVLRSIAEEVKERPLTKEDFLDSEKSSERDIRSILETEALVATDSEGFGVEDVGRMVTESKQQAMKERGINIGERDIFEEAVERAKEVTEKEPGEGKSEGGRSDEEAP